MIQDQLKFAAGRAAIDYVIQKIPDDAVLGIGTGSTVNYFIDILSEIKWRFRGAVSSSAITTERLIAHDIIVFDLNDIEYLPVYVDSADEIDGNGAMIKGGGGALTCEKIIASVSDIFICIADASKCVSVLGAFPLPIEVVPMARKAICRRVAKIGGVPVLREVKDGVPYVTDNGNEILDVHELYIPDPGIFEAQINAWPGVVTVGLFAARSADLCLIASRHNVEMIVYSDFHTSW